ncbi:MAG: hypothetical protein A2Y12_01565 [Planctomycetes bacterium GWF2_42_9]|nr:MAG: hypothetical protein A2Y12_01565 [Planctomycetes bacterium GWF2_42_9]
MTKEKKNLRSEIENRIRFETLISDISAQFVRVASSEVDKEIEHALRQILNFFNVDRCGILAVHEDKQSVSITNACYAEGVEQISKDINFVTFFPWSYEKLINGKYVLVSRMTELPSEAQQDRLSWLAMNVKSSLTIPMFSAKGIRHLLVIQSVFKERKWPEEFVPRLTLLGEIFVNALERRNADQALRLSDARVASAIEIAGLGFYEMTKDGRVSFFDNRIRALLGLPTNEESRGREYWLNHIHPADIPKVLQAINRIGEESLDWFAVDYRYMHPSAGTLWFHHQSRVFARDTSGCAIRVVGVIWDITDRKQVESNLIASRQTLREFTSRLLTIQEEERRRLARELHDDFTQELAVVAMDIAKLEISAKEKDSKFKSKLKNIKDHIIKLSTDIHNISRQLHPSIIDDLGLGRAIQSECYNFSKRTGIVVNYKHLALPSAINREISVVLFRITQEALRNIQKHAHVKEADVLISGNEDSIILRIYDSGDGFNPAIARQEHGLGLFSMEERVQLIQGVFSIDSAPGRGTEIKVVVPFKEIDSEQN